jgi:PAS domain S-box-containing protein
VKTLRQFVEFAPDAIVCVDAAGEIVLINDQVGVLFGYGPGELLGERLEVLVPQRLREAHARRRQGYVDDPRTRPMGAGLQLSGRRKDGSEFPAEISLSSVETENGTLSVAAVRDISDRLRAQRKFEQFVEFAPDAIVGVDRGGSIVLVNQQAERLFGYARDELLGGSIERLVPSRMQGVHGAHRAGYFADPRTRPMGADVPLTARRKDGTEFPAEISLSSLETEDGILATAAVRDVTDRVAADAERAKLEAHLHQSQRLEGIGQLAGGIAHDFNNLLGVILNYADFIANGLPAGSALTEDVTEIRRAAERGTSLVRQLLTFSRREEVRSEVVDLNAVVRDLEKLLRRAVGEHVELRLELADELPPVSADAAQLEQVLVNLVVNARDAVVDAGGRISITTAAGDGDEVELCVADTGTGMPPEVIDRAFEPFFSTKPKEQGTGLGLATAYGIVTGHHGRIELESDVGRGTRVRVLLPTTDGAPRPKDRSRHEPEPDGAGTVLVVEDEEGMRRVIERILAGAGYKVVTADDGAAGLAIATDGETSLDLVVSDIVMPGMLGTELAASLGELRPDLGVLLMTGYSHEFPAAPEHCMTLRKPFDAGSLLRGVREALGRA